MTKQDKSDAHQSDLGQDNLAQGDLAVAIIPVTPLQQNCTLVWDRSVTENNRHPAIVIDPGGDVEVIIAQIEAQNLAPQAIWLTHTHADHAGGTVGVRDHYKIPVIGPHKDDDFWLKRIESDGMNFGIGKCPAFEPDEWLVDGQKVKVGNLSFTAIHCPGHTPGHMVFYNQPFQFAQVGDVLFQGSIGRTDFPRGNHDDLINAITQKLWPLGDDVQFVPGHGPMSSFGQERQTNPFVSDRALMNR